MTTCLFFAVVCRCVPIALFLPVNCFAELGIASKLGKQMVKKCGGLPLAISTLGRALSRMPVIKWHKVNDDVQGFLQSEYKIQSDERRDDFLEGPNYDHLSYSAKQCFLYLAIFKDDEDVDLEDLSFLWTAEGMVSPHHDNEDTIIKTTENNLKNLVSRRMLQERVDELSANGRSKRLCLDNQTRELSLHQGRNEGFRLKVLDIHDGKQPLLNSFPISGTRRLVIRFNKLSSPSGSHHHHHLTATSYLRSLFFLNSDLEYAYLPVRIPDLSEFMLLRVLHFVRCKFEGRRLPQGIEKLLNLRYLGLLYCDLDKLPPSISNVQNLQVLNVRAYDDTRITIPNAVSRMVRLKHLRLPNNLAHEQSDKLNLEALHDLETLIGLNADIHDVGSLAGLKKLRHLVTHAYTNDSLESVIKFVASHGDQIQTNLLIQHRCDFTSPRGSTVLEEVLMCPNLDAVTFSMVLMKEFPYCGDLASERLSEIKLIGCKLVEDPMDAMGKFVNLQKLCLGNGAFVGGTMAIRSDGFPKLEYLEFRCLPRLESWKVEEGAMVKLCSLIVTKCPKLKVIPNGLASVRSLKNLEIELPPTALAGGQERNYIRKFAFVRSLIIRYTFAESQLSDSISLHFRMLFFFQSNCKDFSNFAQN